MITQVATLLLAGGMALQGVINAEQLTAYVLYVEFVAAASLSVCDQWGPFMEALGASERVISYLDRPPAPQISPGRTLPHWDGKVSNRHPKHSPARLLRLLPGASNRGPLILCAMIPAISEGRLKKGAPSQSAPQPDV